MEDLMTQRQTSGDWFVIGLPGMNEKKTQAHQL